ncbi:MAG: RNA polymerase sporulation sigma factor SigK [Lachnospiraceae bacterium]|nr:RNA polymerase sporulation sigma factor SigK [Lachnospiraceae bacterium]MDD3795372.1 RNA polymerase sporulation sigma factor SigK [Lachnospiraceae bacterium]
MKTFPKPLSPEDEKHYLQKYKEGDVEARNILIEHNLRLVAHVARKYQGTEIDQDDLISTGIIGLIKAVSTFDFEKNNRLATYAARCIENELLMLLRVKKKLSREVSLYEKIGVDQEGRELNLMDILESEPVDVLEQLEIRKNAEKLYDGVKKVLNAREQQVIICRYGLCGKLEMTQREIAERLGISRSYVSRIEKSALRKLRECFE